MKYAQVAFTMAIATCAGRAAADDDLATLLEQPIVSTPSKSNESARTAPATSTTITAEQLREHGIRALDEALSFLSLGVVTTSPLHAVEVGARGVLLTTDYGTHMLLLVDGHSVHEAWNRTAYFERGVGVPMELVDHIEVSLGPSSVVYGSNAMLGVINIVTKRARDYEGVHVVAEGELVPSLAESGAALADVGDAGRGFRVGAGWGGDLSLAGQRFGVTAQVEYYGQRGPTLRFRPQPYGDDAITGRPKSFGSSAPPGTWGGVADASYWTQAPAVYARIVAGETEVLVRGGMYVRATPYLDGIVADAADFDRPDNYESDRFAGLELRRRFPLSRSVSLEGRVSADTNEYRWFDTSSAAEDCPDGMNRGCARDLLGVGTTLGAEARATFDFGGPLGLATLLGVDGKLLIVHSHLGIVDLATDRVARDAAAYDDSTGVLAVYAEQSARPTRWLDLNGGLRGDWQRDAEVAVSPRAAAAVTPWQGGTVKAIYAEAFRAPSVYERHYADPGDQIASPDLRPERVRSLEGTVEQRFGSHRVLAGVFGSWWRDMVQIRILDDAELASAIARGQLAAGATEAYQNDNLGTITDWGYELAVDGALVHRRLRYGLSVTGSHPRVDPGDGSPARPLTVGPAVFGNARIAYDLGGSWPTVGLAVAWSGRRLADRTFDGGFSPPPAAPAFAELRATVSGAVPAVPDLRYRLGASWATAHEEPYVIGAVQYVDPGSGIRADLAPRPRAKAFVGLEYVFGR